MNLTMRKKMKLMENLNMNKEILPHSQEEEVEPGDGGITNEEFEDEGVECFEEEPFGEEEEG